MFLRSVSLLNGVIARADGLPGTWFSNMIDMMGILSPNFLNSTAGTSKATKDSEYLLPGQ